MIILYYGKILKLNAFVRFYGYFVNKDKFVKLLAAIFFSFLILNLFVNFVLEVFFHIKRSLLIQDDLFGDIVKISFSFKFFNPPPFYEYPGFISDYWHKNPYKGVEGLNAGLISNLGTTPFGVITCYISSYLFNIIGIYQTVYLYIATAIYLFYKLLRKINLKKESIFLIMISFIFSYPFIFMIQRGNFFAFLSFIFLAFSIILYRLNKKSFTFICFLFFIAVLFRPNILSFAPLFIFGSKVPISNSIRLFMVFLITASSSFYIASFLYNDYNIFNFFNALVVYKNQYIIGDSGFAFCISLLSLFKSLNIFYDLNMEVSKMVAINNIFGIAMFACAYFLRYQKLINTNEFIFSLVALNSIFSLVFADYHLLLFFIPIINCLYFSKNDLKKSELIILFSSVFAIVPLNYFLINSYFVFNHLKTILIIIILFWLFCKTLFTYFNNPIKKLIN